jgi:tryptophanyl-tRNA synthetase
VDKEEVLNAFRSSSRILLMKTEHGLDALNAVKELMADRGYLESILKAGEEKAAAVANPTLARVKQALGFSVAP